MTMRDDLINRIVDFQADCDSSGIKAEEYVINGVEDLDDFFEFYIKHLTFNRSIYNPDMSDDGHMLFLGMRILYYDKETGRTMKPLPAIRMVKLREDKNE